MKKRILRLKDNLLLKAFGKKPKNKNPLTPSGVNRTFVVSSFEKKNKWDKHLFDNITVINDD